MEVIKQGDLDMAEGAKIFNCKECGCEFKALKGEYASIGSEIKPDPWIAKQLTGFFYHLGYRSLCPCCGGLCIVKEVKAL